MRRLKDVLKDDLKGMRIVNAAGLMCFALLMFGCAKESVVGTEAGSSERREALRVLETGVNAFLWRASLDATSSLPLASADAQSGVIVTDWTSPPGSGEESFKVVVYVRGPALRADVLRVAVFRRVREDGRWRDAEASREASREIEETIVNHARRLRLGATSSGG